MARYMLACRCAEDDTTVTGSQIQNTAATRSSSLPSQGPGGNVPSDGTSLSFVTQLGKALVAPAGPSTRPAPQEEKRPVKVGRDSGPSGDFAVESPACPRPSVSEVALEARSMRPSRLAAADQQSDQSRQAPPFTMRLHPVLPAEGVEAKAVPAPAPPSLTRAFVTSSKPPFNEVAASDQSSDRSLRVQPAAMDPHPAPGAEGPEAIRATGVSTAQSESAPPTAVTAGNQVIGKQTELATGLLPQSQPSSTPPNNAQNLPPAKVSDTPILTQAELGLDVLQQAPRGAPESPAGITQPDGLTATSPATARPSVSQAPPGTSSQPLSNETASSVQPSDRSLPVQPLAMDQHSASAGERLQAIRAPGVATTQPGSGPAVGNGANIRVDDKMIAKQTDPTTDLLPQTQPSSTPMGSAQTLPCASGSAAPILMQTEPGLTLRQGPNATPESPAGTTQEDSGADDATSSQTSIDLAVETPKPTVITGPQPLDSLLRSLSAAQALSGSNGFGSQPKAGQNGQPLGPSLTEPVKATAGNNVIAGGQANSSATRPEPQLPLTLPAAMIDSPLVRATPSAPNPSPTTYQGVQAGTLGAWEGHLRDGTQIVKAAELIAHLGSVEMRVELRTEDLGPMELRAMMHENRLGAAIGVDNLEAKTALAIELPGLQRALLERNVQLDSISIFSGFSGGTSGHETGYRSSSGNSSQSAGEMTYYRSLHWEEPSVTPGADVWHPGDRWVRLSVRA